MKRTSMVLASALASCAVSACSPDGIDASYDCGTERIYVDCDQNLDPGSASGWIGPDASVFSCNLPITNATLASPQRGLLIGGQIHQPKVGVASLPTQLYVVYQGGCGPLELQSALTTVTIEEFEPSSHIRGTFESKVGNLHGTFDLTCGVGNVFCAPMDRQPPHPP